MSVAIAEVLSKFDFQILWKFNKMGEYADDSLLPLRPYLDSDRMRMPNWLIADPSSLLETGDIVASVHHGGSNCYHEAIAWVDSCDSYHILADTLVAPVSLRSSSHSGPTCIILPLWPRPLVWACGAVRRQVRIGRVNVWPAPFWGFWMGLGIVFPSATRRSS